MKNKDYFYDNYRLTKFYDSIYKHTTDYEYWKKFIDFEQDILEIACGTGRLTIPISQDTRKDVYALDYSQEMLDELENKIKNIKNIFLIKEDMRNFDLKKKFKTILISANSLNHIETNEDLCRTLDNLRHHLTDDGVLLFDVLNPKFEFLLRNEKERYDFHVVKKSDGSYFSVSENNRYNYATQINHVNYYYKVCDNNGEPLENIEYTMEIKVRLFFPLEIDYMIQQNGFEIISKVENYDGKLFEGNTSEQIFVLKKNEK